MGEALVPLDSGEALKLPKLDDKLLILLAGITLWS